MYERLEELLKERNMTAYKLSKETGILTATLSSWKKGTYVPKGDKLQVIASYFGVTVDWLLGKTDDRHGFAPIEFVAFHSKKYGTFPPKIEATPPKSVELRRLLKNEEITLNGRLLTENDKQKMYKIIEAAFWDAKEMNKRKKKSDDSKE